MSERQDNTPYIINAIRTKLIEFYFYTQGIIVIENNKKTEHTLSVNSPHIDLFIYYVLMMINTVYILITYICDQSLIDPV